jgi:hypothetical protein
MGRRMRGALAASSLIGLLAAPIGAMPVTDQEPTAPGEVLTACRWQVVVRVASQAGDDGLDGAGVNVELLADTAAFVIKGTTTEVSGRGRIRMSASYEWQPVTFTCRYDERKKAVSRASYRVDRATAPKPLSPERTTALGACRAAVDTEVMRDARQRGYGALGRVNVDYKAGAAFATVAQGLQVSGAATFKRDPQHKSSTPISYVCVYDPAANAVRSATFAISDTLSTASGATTSGTTSTLVCDPGLLQQRRCPASIKGDVRIIRQLGGSKACEANVNWTWGFSGITVWGGCRAEFEFVVR